MRIRLGDLLAGLRCLPDRRGWRKVALELGWSLPLMLVVAHLGGLVRYAPESNASTLLPLGATLLIAPAFGEELLFRGLLIPRRADSARWRGDAEALRGRRGDNLSKSATLSWPPQAAVSLIGGRD